MSHEHIFAEWFYQTAFFYQITTEEHMKYIEVNKQSRYRTSVDENLFEDQVVLLSVICKGLRYRFLKHSKRMGKVSNRVLRLAETFM